MLRLSCSASCGNCLDQRVSISPALAGGFSIHCATRGNIRIKFKSNFLIENLKLLSSTKLTKVSACGINRLFLVQLMRLSQYFISFSCIIFFFQVVKPHTPLIRFPDRRDNPKPNGKLQFIQTKKIWTIRSIHEYFIVDYFSFKIRLTIVAEVTVVCQVALTNFCYLLLKSSNLTVGISEFW